MERWEESRWRAAEREHASAVDALTDAHLERRRTGGKHPVEDFLYVYYRHRPGQMRRWHPGPGVVLLGDDPAGRGSWTSYTHDDQGVFLDVPAYLARRGESVAFVRDLLTATASRPPHLGCFGLHEWAMVYRLGADQPRHEAWPLRLAQHEVDDVVDSMTIRCSHFDAYRFFTPPARSLNLLLPTRETQAEHEQPGCLHATMDLYKWAFKLGPAVPGHLLLATFRLARRARELDMRASPYDLAELGYDPVPVETPQGRATYVSIQRSLVAEAAPLRAALIDLCEGLTTTAR
ncbi:MAG: 3-methyladenine DNA glycosylase [Mobilicoccus sp.]|nr:3-methyladenine DNA glycosylase [Mobilicoccus sp.]